MNKNKQKLILSAAVSLLLISSLLGGQSSSGNEIDPFETSPGWPNS